jgi:ABC-type nitrate/sulfonate/bicarbonate transport system substrate-binding protein
MAVRAAVTASALLAASVQTAVASQRPTADRGAGLTEVTLQVGASLASTGSIFDIAYYRGFFAKEGLNLVLTTFAGGPPAVEATLAGRIQIAEYAPSTAVETYKTSNPLVTVGVESGRTLSYAVVSAKYLASKGITPDEYAKYSLKQRIAALNGASFGTHAVGGLIDHYTDILATLGGLKPDDFTKVPLGNNTADQASFDGGVVDAYWPGAVQDQQELLGGNAVNIFDPTDAATAKALFPVELSSGGSGWILSLAWGNSHKKIVERFLQAELDAAQWIDTHSLAAQAKVIASKWPGITLSSILANVTANQPLIDSTLVMPATAIRANVDLADDSGEITTNHVPTDLVWDPTFLKAIEGKAALTAVPGPANP